MDNKRKEQRKKRRQRRLERVKGVVERKTDHLTQRIGMMATYIESLKKELFIARRQLQNLKTKYNIKDEDLVDSDKKNEETNQTEVKTEGNETKNEQEENK